MEFIVFLSLLLSIASLLGSFGRNPSKTTDFLKIASIIGLILSSYSFLLELFNFLDSKKSIKKKIVKTFSKLILQTKYDEVMFKSKKKNFSFLYCNPFENDSVYCKHNTVSKIVAYPDNYHMGIDINMEFNLGEKRKNSLIQFLRQVYAMTVNNGEKMGETFLKIGQNTSLLGIVNIFGDIIFEILMFKSDSEEIDLLKKILNLYLIFKGDINDQRVKDIYLRINLADPCWAFLNLNDCVDNLNPDQYMFWNCNGTLMGRSCISLGVKEYIFNIELFGLSINCDFYPNDSKIRLIIYKENSEVYSDYFINKKIEKVSLAMRFFNFCCLLKTVKDSNKKCCFLCEKVNFISKKTLITKKEYFVQHCISISDLFDKIKEGNYMKDEVFLPVGFNVFEGFIKDETENVLDEVYHSKLKILENQYGSENLSYLVKYLDSKLKLRSQKTCVIDSLIKNTNCNWYRKFKKEIGNWQFQRLFVDISYFLEKMGSTAVKGANLSLNPTLFSQNTFRDVRKVDNLIIPNNSMRNSIECIKVFENEYIQKCEEEGVEALVKEYKPILDKELINAGVMNERSSNGYFFAPILFKKKLKQKNIIGRGIRRLSNTDGMRIVKQTNYFYKEKREVENKGSERDSYKSVLVKDSFEKVKFLGPDEGKKILETMEKIKTGFKEVRDEINKKFSLSKNENDGFVVVKNKKIKSKRKKDDNLLKQMGNDLFPNFVKFGNNSITLSNYFKKIENLNDDELDNNVNINKIINVERYFINFFSRSKVKNKIFLKAKKLKLDEEEKRKNKEDDLRQKQNVEDNSPVKTEEIKPKAESPVKEEEVENTPIAKRKISGYKNNNVFYNIENEFRFENKKIFVNGRSYTLSKIKGNLSVDEFDRLMTEYNKYKGSVN